MPLPARLLTPEETEILDGACEPRPHVVTRHGIEQDVTDLLKRGLTTTSAGGFFFIPYLLQLGAHDLAASLGDAKSTGLPQERLALGLVFESIFGYTAGIRAVDTVSRIDFGLLAGLPFLPSPSTQYRFLQDISVKDGLDFQTALGRRLVTLGQITPGQPINVDAHNLKTYSRKAMKQSFITQEAASITASATCGHSAGHWSPRTPLASGAGVLWPRPEAIRVADAMIEA